jgi:hypothetical protein
MRIKGMRLLARSGGEPSLRAKIFIKNELYDKGEYPVFQSKPQTQKE